MKHILIGAFFLLGLFLHAKSQENENAPLKTFEAIIKKMQENYFDQSYNGLDWPKLTEETRKKITDETDSVLAYNEIKVLLKKLGHSHLEFNPPFSKSKTEIPNDFKPIGKAKDLPFSFEILDGQFLITKVNETSEAFTAGLRPGFIVQEINDHKMSDLLLNLKLHTQLYFSLFRNPNNTFKFSGIDHQNNTFEVKFKLASYTGEYTSFGNIQSYPSEFESSILKENIGYIRFNIFLFDPVKKAVEAIKTMKDCKGIIIDLRNNPGGIGNLSCAIAKEFCDTNYLLGTQRTTANNGISELRFSVQAQKSPYKGKVVILINNNSASTSEVLAIGMQENKSAIVIGTQSPGLALPSLILQLDDGSTFQYPIADFKTPLGQSLESIGVKPDFEVKLSPEKLAAGEDSLISKAIKIILEN